MYPNNTLAPKLTGFDPTLGGRLGTNGPPGFPTPTDGLQAMDEGGLELTVLYPTTLLGYASIVDPDYLVAITRAYNTYVYEDWLKASPRFRAVALMPLLDVEESVKELHRTINALGFVGAFVPVAGFGLLGERRLHPFYAEAERLGCLIAVHGGHATAEYLRYTRFIQRHTVGFPVSNMIHWHAFPPYGWPTWRPVVPGFHICSTAWTRNGRSGGTGSAPVYPEAQHVYQKRAGLHPCRARRRSAAADPGDSR